MKEIFLDFDWSLFLAALLISLLGLVAVSSVGPAFFRQQLVFFFLGWGFFFFFSLIDYRIWEKLAVWLFVVILLFLLTPFIFGSLIRGSLRWIQIGPFNLQPSELVKPFLIIFFAVFWTNKARINLKEVFKGLVLLALPAFLVFFQPDLGSSFVIFLSWLGVLLAAGISLPLLGGGFFAILLFVPVFWHFLKDYQRQRLFSFLRPFDDPLGAGYHLIQATVAVGSGQFLGRGLGRGTQSHLNFLPERHTDFIFAALAEELGFLGAMVLIFAFVFLLWRLLIISRQARDVLGTLICLGVFTLFLSQIVINIGMNLGLAPITGITLPLVSYGGSSFLAMMISLGLAISVGRLKKKEKIAIIA